ncbi:hypothetical protein CAPTEDRAFT_205314 [Capitella teleta]|uniref:CD109 antigen n=1 Tax=Capitella teleta TaxID=283909 RepID=R7TMK1_CAPTE|nr:hypothetical protein CAPTEDRAFT_205314 [Capitella teleta]|eukprot:ELT94762.1 hypothetical protein CAPTEDRAFT_205314 [Capitella teleta]
MAWFGGVLFVISICLSWSSCESDAGGMTGYRLANQQEFLVLAPKKVRPEQTYEVHVTLYKMRYEKLTVRAVLSRNEEEYASDSVAFYDPGTKSIQLEVPITTTPGLHKLSVEGILGGEMHRPVFKNVTEDGNGNIVRRWMQKQLNFGLFESQFQLSYPVTPGDWTFMVEAFGHVYTKSLSVVMWWPDESLFAVNVTTPMYIFDTEWGVAGTIFGEHRNSALYAWGNATISLTVKDKTGQILPGELRKVISYLSGSVPFEFTMEEIKETWGDVANTELHFKGWIKDWYFLDTQNGTAVTKVLKDGVRLTYLGRRLRTFKPNTPVTIYFAVQRADGTPYDGFYNRQIYIQRIATGSGAKSVPEELRVIPSDAIVRYTFYPSESDETIRVTAHHPNTGSQVEVRLFRYFSANNKYLALSSHTDMPKIVAGGNILLGSSLVMNTRQKTFSVAVSHEMAPTAKIVAYCVTNGEIVVDSLSFFVQDKRLTTGPFVHTWYYDDARWEESTFFSAPTNGMDTLSTVEASGLIALSDMNMTVLQEYTSCNRTLGLGLCPNGQCYKLSHKCDGTIHCNDGYDEVACPPNKSEMWSRRQPDIKNLHFMPRYFDPTDWMWKAAYIKPNGQVELRLDVPEYTDSSVMSGFILHPEHGLSLVEQPVEHDTSRLFLMFSEAPCTIRRGEQVGIRLALLNNWDQDQEIILMLHGGEDYRFIRVEEFGFVSSYNPRLLSGDIQTMIDMKAGEKRYVMMPIVPLIESGQLEVRISAYGPLKIDTEVVTIDVKYDGVGITDFIPYLLDLVNQGSQLIPDFNIPIPERFVEPGQRDVLYIPGSNVVSMGIHGDMVLPGLMLPQLSLFETIDTNLSPESADGYMFDYAVNLQTLNYLQVTNSLSREERERSLEFMRSILMRQYSYLQNDGSMKMFRRNSESCVWLTAYCMKVLHATVISQWSEQVFIPIDILNKMATWLSKQQIASGAVIETSEVYYNQNYRPFVRDMSNQTQEWHIPTTALTVIAMSLGTRLTGSAKIRADEVSRKGADYLAEKYLSINDPFQLAITAYALEVAKHRQKDNAYMRLRTFRRSGEFVYWASKEIPPNVVNIINTVPIMEPRSYFENLENSVMATSYSLMLYLAHNQLAESVPIMKWIVFQHKHLMFWSSTQDTLLALEALSEYAYRETNRDFYKLTLYLSGTAKESWGVHSHTLNKTNFDDLKVFPMQRAYGEIRARAIGTGYAYLGMKSYRHMEKAYQIEAQGPSFASYDIEVAEMSFRGRNASSLFMTICASWTRTDLYSESGMTFLKIAIPSGYTVTRDAIHALYSSGVPGLRRARFYDQTLVIFMETFTATRKCVSFEAKRWYPVANMSIAHDLQIRNYAEEGLYHQTSWEAYTLFHLHICQVCGSFQCPYCQFYNHSSLLSSTLLGVVVSAMLAMFVSLWY